MSDSGQGDRPSFDDLALGFAGAVLYASLFEYPLTADEVRQSFLATSLNALSVMEVFHRSRKLQELVEYKDGFFFPAGQQIWIEKRHRREKRSLRLLAGHRTVMKLLLSLPFVRLVALSGSIGHLNVEPDSDIDLLIITRGQRVWSTAVSSILMAKLLGCRNEICLNFFLSDTNLRLARQDLFDANQMIHLRPLDQPAVLDQFLAENAFVRDFYPEFKRAEWPHFQCRPGGLLRSLKTTFEFLLSTGLWKPWEWFCRTTYRAYLLRQAKRWPTQEEVILSRDLLKLHGQSHRRDICREFEKRLRELLQYFPSPSAGFLRKLLGKEG